MSVKNSSVLVILVFLVFSYLGNSHACDSIDVDGDNYFTDACGGIEVDCNDNDDAINAAATEICDDVDNDCDGDIDDDDSDITGQSTWYLDADSDTYGHSASSVLACDQPAQTVSNGDDCNDLNANINPSTTEICDGIDNDCDGNIDDADSGITGQTTWYNDSDGDTYGDINSPAMDCDQPTGYVSDNTDCDDLESANYPGAIEICGDSIDQDCDGSDDLASAVWYADDDGDGFGDLSDSQTQCEEPAGYVSDSTDCDDTESTVNTSGTETCEDTIDQDCDGADSVCPPSTETNCTDLADGDFDGNTDCDDSDCDVDPACLVPVTTETDCDDTLDDDSDGDIDCDDSNCDSDTACATAEAPITTETECDDTLDDDSDGDTDCDDSDCAADSVCIAPITEETICTDSLDDDLDDTVDCDDADCISDSACLEDISTAPDLFDSTTASSGCSLQNSIKSNSFESSLFMVFIGGFLFFRRRVG